MISYPRVLLDRDRRAGLLEPEIEFVLERAPVRLARQQIRSERRDVDPRDDDSVRFPGSVGPERERGIVTEELEGRLFI